MALPGFPRSGLSPGLRDPDRGTWAHRDELHADDGRLGDLDHAPVAAADVQDTSPVVTSRHPLQEAHGLTVGMLRVALDPVQDRELLPESRLEALLRYSPRSSLGANGLSEAPPDASGCSTKKTLFFSMKLFHSPGTLSPG
jgi:hypothetical protein